MVSLLNQMFHVNGDLSYLTAPYTIIIDLSRRPLHKPESEVSLLDQDYGDFIKLAVRYLCEGGCSDFRILVDYLGAAT